MPSDLPLRNIPDHIKEWIEEQSHLRRMSQNEFILEVLKNQRTGGNSRTPLLDQVEPAEVVVPESLPFSFIDLFAGIGGFRIGLTRVGGECVWSCEYDKFSQKTYKAWFSDDDLFGDINELQSAEEIDSTIPDHDVLAAGFPCQPFSIAGVSKKNALGHAHGFDCEDQGNLFFKIAQIAKVKRPPVLFLENVKNLKSHDSGNTWDVIQTVLNEELEYEVFDEVIDAAHWVPQHRERIMIVCFDRHVFDDGVPFDFPDCPAGPKPKIGSILEDDVDDKYTLSDKLWNYLQEYAEKHRKKGNGFGYGLVKRDDQARTMSARYYKDGSEILVYQGEDSNPRRLSPSEAARLMGFDERRAQMFGHEDGFPQVVSDTQAYKQFGNAVVPAVVEAVGREIVKTLDWHIRENRDGCLLKTQGSEQSVPAKSPA